MSFVRIALDVPLDRLFDYRCDDATQADIGRFVVVPFGRGRKVGLIVAVTEDTEVDPSRVRAVQRVARDLPGFSAAGLHLLRFCSRYYHHPLGATILGAVPTGLRRADATALAPRQRYRLTAAGEALSLDAIPVRSASRRALLARFQSEGPLPRSAIAEGGDGAIRALRALLTDELVRLVVAEETAVAATAAPAVSAAALQSGPALTAEQQTAVDTVCASFGRFRSHLLAGVTGSGKTEVYLQLIEATLGRGGQALLLVPEINLTPQLEARLTARFGAERLVTLHSNLAEGERLERWLRVARGEVPIVVGTRLAVFAPLPRLGLVLVDEEHDGSYKQQEGLRYNARDVAVFLAKQHGVPVVLGSATPSLESYAHAKADRYGYLPLRQRAAGQPPAIRPLDIRDARLSEGLAPAAVDALKLTLAAGEQSLVFVNRRGYAPTLLCHGCGWVAPCHRCSARLTLHAAGPRLHCHYCGHEEAVPSVCPSCGNQDLRAIGAGTQRVEQALSSMLPTARIARIDRDTTRRKHAFRDVRDRVAAGELDLLVGTQMLAKGHDFPRLTRVIVLGADYGLAGSDFRAEERLFALLLQVAGRAGRADLPGEVLIQTTFPDHPLFRALADQDFDGFAAAQLETRRTTGFPPYIHQALLRAEAPTESAVFEFLRQAAAAAPRDDGRVFVYDPVPALMPRLAGRWRGQLLVQSGQRPALQSFLDQWLPALHGSRVRWSIDVDPLDF